MPEKPQGELTYLMGGEIDRGSFELVVRGDNIDPEEITRLLGAEPTTAHRTGALSDNGKYRHRTGSWNLQTGELDFRSGDRNCEDQFADWVASLPGDEAIWARILEQHEAYVWMVLYMNTWNREFDVRPSTLNELGKRGLRLHIDTYYDPDDEEPNQTLEDTGAGAPSPQR